MVSKVVHSSKKHDYGTPWDIFNELDHQYHFTVDCCASKENTKCRKYWDIKRDGLKQSWLGKQVWCNPPYSHVEHWVDKGITSINVSREHCTDTTVVYLLPSRTDTRWFKRLLENAREICFLSGSRVRFQGCKTGAPFPTLIAVVSTRKMNNTKISYAVLKWKDGSHNFNWEDRYQCR